MRSMNTLFLLHVMKTAGSSLAAELCQVISPNLNVYVGYEVHEPGGHRAPMLEVLRGKVPDILAERYAFVHGHFYFSDFVDLIGLHGRHITFLRHPVSRRVSYYHHKRKMNNGKYPPIEEEIEWSGYCNAMFAQLSLPGETPEQLADRILDTFYFVGLYERYDQDFRRLFLRLGLDGAPTQRIRIGSYEPPSLQLVKRIEALNSLDMALYERAISRLG